MIDWENWIVDNVVGWLTEVSNNLISVLMLLHSMNKSEIIDIVKVSSMHHQSEFLLKITKEILAQCPVNMNAIKCIVTESPTPMLKSRHLLSEEYSHIVPLPGPLLVANLLTKDICRLEGLTDIVKGNCKIVNFHTNGFMHPKNGQRRTRTISIVSSLSVRLIGIPCARCAC